MRSRRKHPRYRCDFPCRMRVGQGIYDAQAINLSAQGLFLESEIMMDEGSVFGLEVDAGGPAPVDLQVELVHWRHQRPEDGDEARMGFGVRLTRDTPAFQELVESCSGDLAD